VNGPPIDPERLAALLDGRLAGRERDEALARLAALDDEALGAYADAAAVTRELEAEDAAQGVADAKVLSFRAPRRARRPGAPVLALAATLAAVALGVGTWAARGGRDADDPGRYAALRGGTGVPAGWDAAPWTAVRAADAPLDPRVRAVRVGARLTDLQAAAAARDVAGTRQAAADVQALLAPLPAAGPAAAVYGEVRRRAGEPAAALEPALARGRRSAARLAGEEGVALGAWAEAARLAAARHDAAFFRARATRQALARAGRLDLPAARAALDRLRAISDPPDWASLQRDATALLAAAGQQGGAG
jgi:hypothetical protein